jgi:hypothetical protein
LADWFGRDTKLIDDFGDSHKVVRAVWINGRGEQREAMNVAPNVPVWFLLAFDEEKDDIKKARIEFRAFTGGNVEGKVTGGQ